MAHAANMDYPSPTMALITSGFCANQIIAALGGCSTAAADRALPALAAAGYTQLQELFRIAQVRGGHGCVRSCVRCVSSLCPPRGLLSAPHPASPRPLTPPIRHLSLPVPDVPLR